MRTEGVAPQNSHVNQHDLIINMYFECRYLVATRGNSSWLTPVSRAVNAHAC